MVKLKARVTHWGESLNEYDKLRNLQVGDYIKFGLYEQDCDNISAIEWLVYITRKIDN